MPVGRIHVERHVAPDEDVFSFNDDMGQAAYCSQPEVEGPKASGGEPSCGPVGPAPAPPGAVVAAEPELSDEDVFGFNDDMGEAAYFNEPPQVPRDSASWVEPCSGPEGCAPAPAVVR